MAGDGRAAAEPAYAGAVASRTPDKIAVVFADSGEQISYARLDDRANRLARAFWDQGLRPGDPVALMLDNGIEYLEIACAAQYAGLAYVPISTRLKADEVAYMISDSGSTVVLYSDTHAQTIAEAARRVDRPLRRIQVGGSEPDPQAPQAPQADSYLDVLAGSDPHPLPDRREGRAMYYSSGTTGTPKGIRFPTGTRPLGTPDMITRLCHRNFGLGADSIFLSPAPLYHGAPLKFCMTALAFGSTVILQSHFDATDVLRAIEKYSVTHIQLVPTHFVRLLKLPEPVRRSYDLTSLKVAIHSAAPCPVEVKRAMIDWWGPIIHEYYSGSEGVGMTYCESADWLAHPGTVGRPVFGDLYICGEDGTELPVGDIGLVYFGGASTFKYHNDEAKTDAARNLLHPDWSTIGDIGRVDQDGFLYLTDRRANVIISGGVNIYPQEAENVLLTHPQVADAAVFGVPNAEMSEEVKAVVQPADPAIAGPELELELIAFCRERLAHYKCPRSVEFRTELPREPNGKLIKRLIKAPYWERSTAQT